ncbi:hypothetical protein THASP1DRAFT_31245 [Thamnocephalis sphaerospora]|uniref:Uncharacterized protein n=1 Tax=Thamnocephalis sphaerospora TaxID=78915 RepID=A0A4P9XM12_9FUNG|nr:hypothetical protein THASP1DRAFT_31245 [Thamnocephalis sphaerospora]|eukprot:RKP06937.1 hypothetical protein THASP1DRAFT_31245 [Thamnocephalis sphaerospora]
MVSISAVTRFAPLAALVLIATVGQSNASPVAEPSQWSPPVNLGIECGQRPGGAHVVCAAPYVCGPAPPLAGKPHGTQVCLDYRRHGQTCNGMHAVCNPGLHCVFPPGHTGAPGICK